MSTMEIDNNNTFDNNGHSNGLMADVSNCAVIEAVTKIHNMKFKKENTLIELTEMFYGVCREFGIKQGTPAYTEDGELVGRNCDTPQWTIVKYAFERKVVEYFSLWDILEEPPKDLMM